MRSALLAIGKKTARQMFRVRRPLPKKPQKILFFKVGALGDVLMTTPLVRALKKRFPKAKMEYLVGNWSAPVLAGNPHLDALHTFDDKIFFSMKAPALLRLAAKMRRQAYDLVIVLDRSYAFGCYARMFGAPTAGFDRDGEGFMHSLAVPYGDAKHDIGYYLDIAKKLGCATSDKKMEIYPTARERAQARKRWNTLGFTGKTVIGIMPGGGTNPGQNVLLKRWPHFDELAQRLLDEKKEVVAFGGKSDSALMKSLPEKTLSLMGKTSLGETAVLMSMCDAIITNDSGPMHLASAMAKKTIAIFGPTDPKKLAPLGKNHHTLWAKTTRCPPCNPKGKPACYQDGRFPDCPTHACMRNISVEHVMKVLQKKTKKPA